MKNACLFGLITSSVLFSLNSNAVDWPNFRGPSHNGISAETGWSAKWPAEGPKQLWKASLGVGYASIIVGQGHALATGNDGTTATIYCFDAETGSNQWKFSYPNDLYSIYNPPRGAGGTSGSPTIDGDRVYLLSGDGCLYSFKLQTGEVVWTNNLYADLGASKPKWGFTSSALVQDNLLILDLGGHGTAVDKTTGKMVWTSDKEAAGYSTPVPCKFNSTAAVAILSADTAYAVETKTGNVIWSFPFKTQDQLNIADVVVSGNDIYLSAAYNHGGVMAHLDGTNAGQVWANKNFANHVCTSILIDGNLYGVAGSINGRPTTLQCIDFATGAQKWTFPGVGIGGFIVADHKLIVLSDRGELLVGDVSPESFTPISRAQVVGSYCWSSPTLANGRIYCRNNKGEMVCVDVKSN